MKRVGELGLVTDGQPRLSWEAKLRLQLRTVTALAAQAERCALRRDQLLADIRREIDCAERMPRSIARFCTCPWWRQLFCSQRSLCRR